jgi:hypothetical protein
MEPESESEPEPETELVKSRNRNRKNSNGSTFHNTVHIGYLKLCAIQKASEQTNLQKELAKC